MIAEIELHFRDVKSFITIDHVISNIIGHAKGRQSRMVFGPGNLCTRARLEAEAANRVKDPFLATRTMTRCLSACL